MKFPDIILFISLLHLIYLRIFHTRNRVDEVSLSDANGVLFASNIDARAPWSYPWAAIITNKFLFRSAHFLQDSHTHNSQKKNRFEPRCSRRVSSSFFLLDTRHLNHGQASDAYAYVWMMQCSLLSWITFWNLCHTLNRCKAAYCHGIFRDTYNLYHAMKECRVASFHGQASDAYAYAWMMTGSLFSWITLWNL
jgi:hypothetical protein